ncbi:MAG: helix-turn-helix domain-containing protein [Pseudomonadota bacterium]
MDISRVARQSGQSAATLRYYEERGLIHSIGRIGLKRAYDNSVFDRLALISLGRAAGFSLNEIKQMFRSSSKLELNREQLLNKAGELDEMIARLQLISEGLKHTAACTAPSHMECENFQRILKAAGHGLLTPLVPLLSSNKKVASNKKVIKK